MRVPEKYRPNIWDLEWEPEKHHAFIRVSVLEWSPKRQRYVHTVRWLFHLRLEKVGWSNAEFWLRRQTAYNLMQARNRGR